jgi:hypothetical protein
MQEFSQHNPFGHRTRIDWYLEGDPRRPEEKPRYEHLSIWMKNRYEQRHPEQPKVAALRIYRAYFHVGTEAMARPEGKWVRPPPETVDPKDAGIVHTQTFEASR